eukprot:7350403-Prymnesium_polylepis.1
MHRIEEASALGWVGQPGSCSVKRDLRWGVLRPAPGLHLQDHGAQRSRNGKTHSLYSQSSNCGRWP